MNKNVTGYIVLDEYNIPLLLCEEDDGKSILLSASSATVFAERKQARNALLRTKSFAKRHNYEEFWHTDNWRIMPVSAHSPSTSSAPTEQSKGNQ